MKNLRYSLGLIVLPLLFLGCNPVDNTVHGSLESMVDNTSKELALLPVQDLGAMIGSQEAGVKIIDVREREEFEAGHIPGAINIPRGLVEFSNQLSNRRETIIVYANHLNRATLSATALGKLKYKNVKVLDGGFEAWQRVFPDRIEEGSGTAPTAAPVAKASAGGCGD